MCMYSYLVESQRMILLEKRNDWFSMDASLDFFEHHELQRFQELMDAADEETIKKFMKL